MFFVYRHPFVKMPSTSPEWLKAGLKSGSDKLASILLSPNDGLMIIWRIYEKGLIVIICCWLQYGHMMIMWLSCDYDKVIILCPYNFHLMIIWISSNDYIMIICGSSDDHLIIIWWSSKEHLRTDWNKQTNIFEYDDHVIIIWLS